MNSQRNLKSNQISYSPEPFLSEYLTSGFQVETVQITDIIQDDQTFIITSDIENYFVSKNDASGFHLSALLANNMISQMGIICCHLVGQQAEKNSEVFMKDIFMNFHRPIRKTRNIVTRIFIKKLISNPYPKDVSLSKHHYTLVYSIEDGAFAGEVTLCCLFPKIGK